MGAPHGWGSNFCIASCSFLQHLSSCWGSGLPIFDRLRNGLRPVLYSIMLAFSNFLFAKGCEIPIRSAEGRGPGFGRSLLTFFVMRLVLFAFCPSQASLEVLDRELASTPQCPTPSSLTA